MRLLLAFLALSSFANAATFSAGILVQVIFPQPDNYIVDIIDQRSPDPVLGATGSATADATPGQISFDPSGFSMFAGFPATGTANPVGSAIAFSGASLVLLFGNLGGEDITLPINLFTFYDVLASANPGEDAAAGAQFEVFRDGDVPETLFIVTALEGPNGQSNCFDCPGSFNISVPAGEFREITFQITAGGLADSPAEVPEPSTLVLSTFAGLAFIVGRARLARRYNRDRCGSFSSRSH